MYKIIFGLLVILSLAACSDSDGGGKSAGPGVTPSGVSSNGKILGQFSGQIINYDESIAYNPNGSFDSCKNKKQIDPRLKPGLTITSDHYVQNLGKPLESFSEARVITGVDFVQNIHTSQNSINVFASSEMRKGITNFDTSCEYHFAENYDYSACMPMANGNSIDLGSAYFISYSTCSFEFDGEYGSDTVLEKGTFTFADGKTMAAERQTRTESGNIVCRSYDETTTSTPIENKLGLGTSSSVTITTLDMPSRSYNCGGIENLAKRTEFKLANGQPVELVSEEITGGKF